MSVIEQTKPVDSVVKADVQKVAAAARQDIKALTGLRVVPAITVILFHVKDCFPCWGHVADNFYFPNVVTFFFVLSGFILTLNYQHLKGFRSTFLFYLARFSRVWPAHAITLALLVWLIPEAFKVTPTNAKTFFMNLFMVHAWVPDWNSYFSFNSPAWSNSTEFFFYLAFPLLLVALKKRWWLPLIPTVIPMVAMIAYCNNMKLPEFSYGLCNQGLLYVNPVSRIFEFAVGMVAANLFITRISKLNVGAFAASVAQLSIVASFLILNYYMYPIRNCAGQFMGPAGAFWVYNTGFAVLVVAALFISLALEKGILSRILSTRVLVFLGEVSFGAYMLHCVLLAYRGINMPFARSPLDSFLFVAILIVGSHFMGTALERPLRAIILKAGNLLKKTDKGGVEPEAFKKLNHKKGGSKKRNLLLALEGAVLAGLIYFALPVVHRVSAEEANALSAGATVNNAAFEPLVKLRSGKAVRDGKKVQMTLVWEALNNHPLNYMELNDVLDQSGKQILYSTHMQDLRGTRVKKGDLWSETFELESNAVGFPATAENVSIRLMKGKRKPLFTTANGAPSLSLTVPISKN